MGGARAAENGAMEAENQSSESDSVDVDVETRDDVYEDGVTEFGDLSRLTAEDIMKKVFRTEEGAYEFFRGLGKCYGFGVRKGDSGRDERGRLIRRRLFCNRAGLRERKHYERVDRVRDQRPETRTNCEAKLCIYFDIPSGLWRVRKVVLDHNHDLTPVGMVHMIPSLKEISCASKAQIDGMHAHGVPTSKIVGYMASQSGGYSFMGFSKKDAYNYVDKCRRTKIGNKDCGGAVIYLEGLAGADPMCMARYNLTNSNMMANLFWANGGSRVDYQYFGDVLAFDSTCKKNKYRRPLVIFFGSNNHKQTVIFGFGMVLDESIGSYKWLLENFLEVMYNKMPSVIVTDGCDSMKAAIKAVFSDAIHRLCAWHIEKNVTANVKDEGLRQIFNKSLYADIGIDEFEAEWEAAMDEYGIADHLWAKETYDKRKMWANAYLRDKFCASFRTTSCCEGINANLKRFLKSRHSILEMVQNLELLVQEYRNNEMVAQFKILYTAPVLTTSLDPLEKFAADVYTREIFSDVRKEIGGVTRVNFVAKVRRTTIMAYTLEEYGQPGQHLVVLYERNVKKFHCECCVWERKGYPCHHIFFVMKHEHLKEIPNRLVLKRWRKDAKSLDKYAATSDDGDDRAILMRHGALYTAVKWMMYVGARSYKLFSKTMSAIVSLNQELERGFGDVTTGKHNRGKEGADIMDPVVVRTKVAPKLRKVASQKRRCTNCRRTGHTKRTSTKNEVPRVAVNDDVGKVTEQGNMGSCSAEEVCSSNGHSEGDAFGTNGSIDDVLLELMSQQKSTNGRLRHELVL